MAGEIATSVVIPAFNQGQYVAEAIRSALRQRPVPQVVVVDDGSNDQTRAVCESFGESIVLVAKDNGGVSSARNAGLSAANGEIVVFLDADDVLMDGWIGSVTKAAERSPKGLDAWYADVILFWGPDPALGSKRIPARRRIRRRHLWRDSLLVPSGMAICRAAVDEVGLFNSAVDSCEDWDYWLRCWERGVRFRRLAGASAYHREHPESVSKSGVVVLERRVRFLHHWLASGCLPQRGQLAMEEELARTYLRLVRAVLASDRIEAERWLKSALDVRPRLGSSAILVPSIGLQATDLTSGRPPSLSLVPSWLLELERRGWPIDPLSVIAGDFVMQLAINASRRQWRALVDHVLNLREPVGVIARVVKASPTILLEGRRTHVWWSNETV